MMWQNLVVVFVAGFVSLVRASNYSYVVNTFDAEDTAFFSHMVRDAATGNVYVAGVNTIYELSDSLLMVRRKIIGPKEDSPSCFVQTLSTCPSKRLTDVHAKTVVMDKRNGRLIVCISIYQGACRKYMLSNIEIEDVIQGEGRNKPVVPNDEVASTFGLLAPGKVPSHDVFYIAAQRGVHYASTSQGNVFAISSRHPNNFALIKDDIEGKSRVQLDGILDFSIEYVTAFSYSGFTYFLVVQKSSTQDNNIISKLARVCQKDEKYTSYAEVPLECIAGGTKYNKAQAAYLTRPGKKLFDSLKMNTATNTESLFVLFSIDDSNRSAMCVYTMWDIITKFTENIQQCFNGNGMTGPDHFTNPVQCQKLDSTLFPINDQYCGEHGAGNEPIGTNRLPITHEPVITWDDKVTAIAVTATNDYTVAFVGTENGMLKKVVVETEISATEYKEIPIAPGQKILNNLMFGSQEKYLYVMTSRKLTRIKVEECQKYSGCNQCIINDNDPYCGWCTLESKCTTHNKCANSDKPMHWLPYNNMKCTEITSVSPSMTQIENDQQNLNIYIQNLPTVTGATYKCAFYMNEGSDPLLTIGSKTDRGITCLTPPRQDLPNIPTGTDHITMLLAVRSNGQDFVATNFSFFNCALHASCSTCTRSAFPCTFCVRQHKCTHNGEVCGSDVLVTGVNVPGISERSGPDHCPRIKSNDNKITVASGYAKTVSVEAYNLQYLTLQVTPEGEDNSKSIEVPFKCKFTMSNGNVITKNALKRDSRIECDRMVFSYPATSPTQLIPFQITWGSSEYPLDNPENIQVQIYKCKQLAAAGGVANCGSCLTLSSNYQCGWCQQLSSCLVQQECTASNWLMPRDDCPNPQITSISPSTGPLSGGTLVTINGINLGKDFSDVLNGVSVANVPCIAKQDLYVKTSKIVCVTGASSSARSGTVSATIAGKFSVQSSDKFKYVNPTITHFQPKLGIQAGGARVTFYGKHLNAGTRVIAMLGLNPCRVESKSENEAVCRTSAVTNPTDVTVEMRFDNQTVRASSRFKFVGNPNITDFGRGKGFKIGGLAETITGTNFDAVQEPKMFIDYKGMRYYGACQIVSPTALRCVSPSLEKKVNKRAVGNTEGAVFGFGLDDYEILVNGVFHLYPDPVFNKFENDELIISKKIDSLKIQGSNLSPTLTKNDLSVHIGSGDCDVTLLIPAEEQDDSNFDEIHCKLPPIEDGVNSYQVQVLIGGNTNRTFVIGSLVYEDEEALPLWAYIVLGAGGLIMLVIIIVVIVAYKRKSKQSDKQVQHMQHQMDVLETKVAKECKEAFAELQTDMTEMTSDLTGLIGMPFLDYRSFGMRVLFPNCNEYEHPVVRELEVDYIRQESLERGLRQFGQLMNNKTFLLLFIRTLESNKQFSMRERVNVASLVSVALQGKMEYMTDILKTLLADLIEKSVEGKSHPKLLLRRTESVAEKMLTNWFTFLLFKFLKECAGEPLFMLFRAIKQQVEKGPIDAITGEAKYSLSEDKLIRQQMDYKVLTIYVIEAETYSNQQHPVKVLDVDTISQVKEKILDAIYKNAPFSSRHGREELDLEWHTGAQGRIILQDEDKITAKTEDGGFKRLNTLAHYGVTDNATMALVAKQQQYSNHSILSDKSARSRDYENMTSSPSMSRVLSPNSSSLDVEGGSKLYHLVKPQDSDLQREGERGSKMVSEIYLTRLLATKGTLQQFVDDLFETIFSTAHRGSALPLAIKYMFDFLDDQALLHGITDPETVHTWKSNSLPLRFWVNVIKNPNFVFDVYKSSIVDSCLSVVAQTFMDSCSMSDHRLGKDSPATKLLYAKDIPKYKKWVERYYQDIKLMPAISDQDMNALLAEESRMHQSEFNSVAALNELYQYAIKYNEQLHQILEEDEFARKNRLSHRLEQVHMCMETEV